jgi:hypothetical protein
MATSFEQAVEALYRAPHDAFVAERKRLASELKAGGDKAGAARLAKLGRPPISAWAVNQLWWQEREGVERLLAIGARLRRGDQSAASARRDVLGALRARAGVLLEQGGHAVNEGTLRRVSTTLSALAAAGGFDPDPPGALSADRDPPGFDLAAGGASVGGASADIAPAAADIAPAAGEVAPAADVAPGAGHLAPANSNATRLAPELPPDSPERGATAADSEGQRRAARARAQLAEREQAEQAEQRAQIEREQAAQRAERERRAEHERAEHERQEAERRAEHERLRLELERNERRAERLRLEASLPTLRGDLERRLREVERLRAELARVERLAEEARTAIVHAENRLTGLGSE